MVDGERSLQGKEGGGPDMENGGGMPPRGDCVSKGFRCWWLRKGGFGDIPGIPKGGGIPVVPGGGCIIGLGPAAASAA